MRIKFNGRLTATATILGFILGFQPAALSAAQASPAAAQPGSGQPAPASSAIPASAVTHGSVTVGGRVIPYLATAEEYVFPDALGNPEATMFSVAYTADPAHAATRPVTFLFNGGPGAATIGLRESLAPRKTVAAKNPDGFAFVDNSDSLIDVTDLVFIDPVGTGYSRLLNPAAKSRYWGVEADAQATAKFIAGWLQRHHRAASPVFIVGESYGGIRAAFTAKILAGRPTDPVHLSGIALVSPSTDVHRAGPDVQAIDALPTMAAIARYYGKGSYAGSTMNDLLRDSGGFAAGPYAAALHAGAALPAPQSEKIADRVARFTGLPATLIQSVHLRLTPDYFARHLLAAQGECLSTEDGRVHALISIVDKQPPPYNDPASTKITLTYNPDSALDRLFRTQLGYQPVSPYVRLSMQANQGWNMAVPPGDASGPVIFKNLMASDSHLRLLVFMGYYDLTVPFTVTLDNFNQAHLPATRFSTVLLPAGHQVLAGDASRAASIADLRSFIQGSGPAN